MGKGNHKSASSLRVSFFIYLFIDVLSYMVYLNLFYEFYLLEFDPVIFFGFLIAYIAPFVAEILGSCLYWW